MKFEMTWQFFIEFSSKFMNICPAVLEYRQTDGLRELNRRSKRLHTYLNSVNKMQSNGNMEARELVSDANKGLPTTNVNLLVQTPPILSMHKQIINHGYI
jgi:hypothetical protein